MHWIDAPNIFHTNTLTENISDIQEKTVTTSCSPFPRSAARNARKSSRTSPIRTGETVFLFLQHFIKILKAGGRGGIVIKNTMVVSTGIGVLLNEYKEMKPHQASIVSRETYRRVQEHAERVQDRGR